MKNPYLVLLVIGVIISILSQIFGWTGLIDYFFRG